MKSRMSRIFLWMDLKLHDYYVSSCLTCQINFSLVSVGTIWTNGTACSVLLVSTSIAKSNSFMFICLFCPLGSRHLVKLLSSHQRRFFLLLAWVLSIQSVNKKKKKCGLCGMLHTMWEFLCQYLVLGCCCCFFSVCFWLGKTSCAHDMNLLE